VLILIVFLLLHAFSTPIFLESERYLSKITHLAELAK